MKKYIIVFAIIFAGMAASAQKLQEDEFAKANKYYNDSQYDSALIVYNRIIDEGYVSSSLYYNIANAQFKLRDIPMAIYNYERALKLDPTNEDIKANLEIANALTTDKIEPLPVFFITKIWIRIGNAFTSDTWAWISIIMFAILLIVLYLYFTARTKALKKSMFFTGILLILLNVACICLTAQKANYMKSHNEAIVINPTITVKSSPSSSGVDLFVLHEGTKLEVKESVKDRDKIWNKIKIADGSQGWMPADAMIRF